MNKQFEYLEKSLADKKSVLGGQAVVLKSSIMDGLTGVWELCRPKDFSGQDFIKISEGISNRLGHDEPVYNLVIKLGNREYQGYELSEFACRFVLESGDLRQLGIYEPVDYRHCS